METSFNSRLTTGVKVFLIIAIVISVFNTIRFVFYGNHFYELATALGFALMSYDVYKNGLFRRKSKSDESFDNTANYLSIIGIILVLIAIVLRFSSL